MANPTSSQVPLHVTALLSHLTSRPGVQSTLILSRKDGSIIRCTGLLATTSSSSVPNQNGVDSRRPLASTASATDNAAASDSIPAASVDAPSSTSDPASPTALSSAVTETQPQTQSRYQPSHAETLAAHIYAFVSSASALSGSLSHPTGRDSQTVTTRTQSPPGGGYASRSTKDLLESNGNGNGAGAEEDSRTGNGRSYNQIHTDGGESDGRENKEEDDEVKLLRLRTKKHEIVVVPDKKYLLCVVHDAAGAAASGGGGGATGGGSVLGAGPGRRSSK